IVVDLFRSDRREELSCSYFHTPKEASDDAAFLLVALAATLCIQVCLRRCRAHAHGFFSCLWRWFQFRERHYPQWPGKLDLLVLDSRDGQAGRALQPESPQYSYCMEQCGYR